MEYAYQSEKLSAARYALMLPNTGGAESAISEAFHECRLAFNKMDDHGLDDSSKDWVEKIKVLMELPGPLSMEQQRDLSRLIDELAHWFNRKVWVAD